MEGRKDEVEVVTASGAPSESASPRSTSPLAHASSVAERSVEQVGDLLWRRLKHRPYLAVGLASGLGLAAASLIGVGELVVAAMAGYAAYQVVKKRVPPSQAVREAIHLEQNLRV